MKLLRHRTVSSLTAQLLLLALTTVATGQVAVDNQDLLIEWRRVQVEWKREDQGEWWQRLDAGRLDAFIDAGADVNLADRRGWTPLHSAARYSPNPGIVSALIESGAVVGAKNRAGDTPLHWAARENANVEIVQVLLRAGADIHQRDKFGWLPIHTAAESSANPDVIAALLEAGSERNKRAYFILFRPAFLLKHNANMPKADKVRAMGLLRGVGEPGESGKK